VPGQHDLKGRVKGAEVYPVVSEGTEGRESKIMEEAAETRFLLGAAAESVEIFHRPLFDGILGVFKKQDPLPSFGGEGRRRQSPEMISDYDEVVDMERHHVTSPILSVC